VTTSKGRRSRTDTLPAGVKGSPPILKELFLIEKGRIEDAVSASHITLQTGRSRNEAGEFSPKQFTGQGDIPPPTKELQDRSFRLFDGLSGVTVRPLRFTEGRVVYESSVERAFGPS
jgi:hypothetical protein